MESHQSWGKTDGGIGYCHTKWKSGLVVSGIEVWSSNYHIAGMQYTFSDGSKYQPIGSTTYGTNKAENNMNDGGGTRHYAITWDPREKVTTFGVRTNHDGKALGLVHIEVGSQKLQVTSNGMGNGDFVNLGSGLLLGASGTSSGFVNSFTPLFMGGSKTSGTIVDIQFDESLDDLNAKQQGLSAVSFGQMYIENTNPPGGDNQAWQFAGSVTKEQTTTISVTDTNGFSLSNALEVSAKVEIPEVATLTTKDTTTAGWTTSKANFNGTTSTQDFSGSWSQSSPTNSTLEPGHAQNCTAVSTMGSYNGGFTSTIQITVAGKEYTYKQRGTLQGISYTQVISSCEEMLLTDIPQGSLTQEASNTIKKGQRKRKRAARRFAA